MLSLDAMSHMARGGGSWRKLLMALLVLVALLLLYRTMHNSQRLQQLQQRRKQVKPLKATAPPVQLLVEPVDDELVRQLEQELPEVDYDFWYNYAMPFNYRMNKTCAQYPDPLLLQLHNVYWQTFSNANVTFRLFAAYMDNRIGVNGAYGVVRILATANQIGDAFPATYCQLWYEDSMQPIVTNVSEHLSIWVKKWGSEPLLSYPHLLTCPVPYLPPNLVGQTPRTVSLVRQSCHSASNSLRVHNDRPKLPSEKDNTSKAFYTTRPPLSFGVCVKAFDFPYVDLSERLIEWFELQRLLGASRIYAYIYDVHPAVQRVLDYYQRIGYLELRPLTMANGMPRLRHYQHLLLKNQPLVKRLNELIPYNDCFYRNMYRHDYLLNVDVDEVIMPMGALRTWQDILDHDQKLTKASCPNGFVSLCYINAYFTKVVPEADNHEEFEADELYVLQHTMRYQNYSPSNQATKCMHNTRFSLTLHNHFTLKWLKGSCNLRTIDKQVAHMQHYREPLIKYKLTELIEDRNAWKYATDLRAAVEQVRAHLDDVQAEITGTQNALQELPEEDTDQLMDQERQQMFKQALVLN